MTAAFALNSDGASVVKYAQLDNGTIRVAYNSDNNKKLKLMVEKDSKRIYYNLRNDGTAESFPLQFGNGNYIISIMENIEGIKYRYITSETVKLALEDQNEVYLASIQNINWNEDMEAIKEAKELTKGLDNDQEKVKAIYDYIVNNIKYDMDKLKYLSTDYLPDNDATFTTNKGICYDYSSIFAAMLRGVGIPAKLVKGYSKDVNGYHAWNEVYNSDTGRWEIIDATYDSKMKAEKVKYFMVKKGSSYSKVNEY
jgi:transglutaminase-like putative cysteine protease